MSCKSCMSCMSFDRETHPSYTFAMENEDNAKEIGVFATVLATTELGLGSVLHALHIPFSGQFLSLNQLFCLNSALRSIPNDKHACTWISLIAASLKSVSPVGKKLTPMLAIAMQGALFNAGALAGGVFGRLLGATLMALWGFVQPVLVYTLIFGEAFWTTFQSLNNSLTELWGISDSLFISLWIGAIFLKVIVAWGIVLMPISLGDKYTNRLKKLSSRFPLYKPPSQREKSLLWTIIRKDFCNPTFLTVLIGVSAVSFATQESLAWWGWQLFRCISVGFIFFFLMRAFPLQRMIKKIEHFPKFRKGVEIVLENLTQEPAENLQPEAAPTKDG